ncbi:hypothetical protein EJD97_022159 [Solanum chilense]|uniref:Secreted protein n=1 Tax=Solanum chilense TaxID=4083 RepID=A0A6N2AU59_SOLCI|nr:hypothetical protein EJD97_022159 [Solanum chilense]
MMQMLLAAAFMAAPLTLFLPPFRSLNSFVESLEFLHYETTSICNLNTVLRFRDFFSRYMDIPHVLLLSSPPPPTLR